MTGRAGDAVRAVVFDMDGTLVDSMEAVPLAYVETIRALGGPTLTARDVLDAFHVGPPAALLAHFLGRPATPEDQERFHRTFESMAATTTAFPGVVELLDELVTAGLPLAVFTGAGRRSAAYLLGLTTLADRLPIVVGGDDAGRAKPAPDGLWLACERLGVRANEAAYVGDSEVDVGCARNAGALAVHASWGASAPPHTTPDVVVDHPAKLTAALGSRV